MVQDDVEEVGGVERLCFTNPWPLSAYRRELRNPDQNFYIVLRDDPAADTAGDVAADGSDHFDDNHASSGALSGTLPSTRSSTRRSRRFAFWNIGRRGDVGPHPPIIGFAGMWNLYDEAHVTTIGVVPKYRGRGLGEVLFVAMLDEAIRRQVTWVTLEVRVSNISAQNLYRKYGFTIQGRRPRYYSDNNEDAFIMWSDSLKKQNYLVEIEQRRRQLSHKMSFDQQMGPV